jgi:hypothetical protein
MCASTWCARHPPPPPVTATQVGAQPPVHPDGGRGGHARGRRRLLPANGICLTDHVPPGYCDESLAGR